MHVWWHPSHLNKSKKIKVNISVQPKFLQAKLADVWTKLSRVDVRESRWFLTTLWNFVLFIRDLLSFLCAILGQNVLLLRKFDVLLIGQMRVGVLNMWKTYLGRKFQNLCLISIPWISNNIRCSSLRSGLVKVDVWASSDNSADGSIERSLQRGAPNPESHKKSILLLGMYRVIVWHYLKWP